jgi:hypothetical protein
MKKRIFAVLLALVLLLASVTVVAAEDTQTDADDTTVSDDAAADIPPSNVADTESTDDDPAPSEPVVPEQTPPAESVNHTFVGRVMEFANQYRQELIDVCGFLGMAIAALFALFKQRRNGQTVAAGVSSMLRNTSDVSTSQSGVVNAVNEMIGTYNKMSDAYVQYATSEDERNRLVGAMVVQNAAILEILSTVYANSKNLPQGVKDIVNLKYAKCLTMLENDEKLTAFVKDVRSVVNGESNGSEKEAVEEAEK